MNTLCRKELETLALDVINMRWDSLADKQLRDRLLRLVNVVAVLEQTITNLVEAQQS